MRDYVLLAIVFASLPVGLFVPYYGLLVYAWFSYMYPHTLTWSFARHFPSAKLMACATIAGALLTQDIDIRPLRRPETILMILLFICFTVSTALAIYPEIAWVKWQDVSKVIVMALV